MLLPMWVDARDVLTSDGAINRALFDPGTQRLLEHVLSTPDNDEGCVDPGIVLSCPERSFTHQRDSLEAAVRTSELVVLGRVTGKSYGFNGSSAGQLLRIETVRVFKGRRVAREHYLPYPIGRFQLGSKTVCKADGRYPKPPEIGDRVLLFTSAAFGEDRNLLQLQGPQDLVRALPNGKVLSPAGYMVAGTDVNAVADEIERRVRGEAGK